MASCSQRPPVAVRSTPTGDGRLQVVVAAASSAGVSNNALRALRFGALTNARVEIAGRAVPAGATVQIPPGTGSATFMVARAVAGTAATVSFTAVDACGDWPSMVGGGVGAF